MMKTILKLTWLFLLAFAVVGCTSDEDSGGPEEENPEYNLDALQGKWYRAYSNNPNADGMEVTVTDNQGTVTKPVGSNFPLNSNKWKDILAVAQNEFEHGELGSDGMYYSGFMKLGVDDTLRINVGHSGAGNTQNWVRTYTEPEPEPEAHECTPYDAETFSGSLTDNWSEPNEKDVYPGLLPAVSDPAGGYYVVTVTTEESTTWIDISTPGGVTIIGGSNGTTDDNVRKVAFSAEPGISYDVSVNPFMNAPTPNFPETYTIDWEYHGIMDCYEYNNTFEQAKFIPKNETIEAFANRNNEGSSINENHMDFYKIVLAEPAKIQVELEQSPSDNFIDIRLYRQDQEGLPASYTYTSGDWAQDGGLYIMTTNSVLEPGIYYAKTSAYWPGGTSVQLDQEGETIPDIWLTPYKFKVTAVQ